MGEETLLSSLLKIGGNQGNYTPVTWNEAGNATALPTYGTSSMAPVSNGGNGGWSWLTGGKNADGTSFNGVGGLALGTLSGLGNMFMGMQNYGLAKDQLKFQKDAYNKNYAAQAKTTNASLEDRQAARVASNPTAYASVSDYMAKNRIA